MFRITEAEYQATKTKVQAINLRAQKRGFTGIVTLEAHRVEVESVDEFGFERTDIWWDVELSGDVPCYNGWEFLATLDWDPHAGLVVRSAPGSPNVDRDSLKENHCDHCNTNRQRNETYLVRNRETNQQLQVGSTCIKDFLGWSTNIVFLDVDSIGEDLGLGTGSGLPDSVNTLYALAVAWALIKLDGYKTADSNGSTKGDVFDVIWHPRSMAPERRQELARIRELAEEAKTRAAECLAWVLSDDFTGSGDYALNLKAVAGADYVTSRNIGILASAPQAWAKWQQRTLIREAEAQQVSNWIGEVGQRLVLTATIKGIQFIPGDFGTTVLYSMRDAAGNIIKWFASREAFGDEVGREVVFKATVKEHDCFRDVKQTLITRAKEQA